MQKKKNYNSGKKLPSTVVPKKKVDKNTVYAFILLAFFIFWTIGSIFAFIDFGKNKQSNVVNACADVVQDFAEQDFLNLQWYDTMLPVTSNEGFYMNAFKPSGDDWHVGIRFPQDITQDNLAGDHVLCPLSFIYDTSHFDSVYIAFTLLGITHDVGFYLWEIDELGQIRDYTFSRMTKVGNTIFSLEYLPEYENAFLVMSLGRYAPVPPYIEGYNFNYDLAAFNVFKLPFYDGNYAYTEDEFRSMYVQAIEDAYMEGLMSGEGYDVGYEEGYEDGYNQAVNNTVDIMKGFFYYADWDFRLHDLEYGDGFTILDFPNMVYIDSNPSMIDFPRSLVSAFAFNGLDYADYLNRDFTFNATNIDIKPELFVVYVDWFLTGDNVTNTPAFMYNNFSVSILDSNNIAYPGVYVRDTEWKYHIAFDWSQFPQGENVKGFRFTSKVSRMQPFLSGDVNYLYYYDYGNDFNVGYDLGFDEGYFDAKQSYDEELNNAYNRGLSYGTQTGYASGYNAGVNAANEYSFTGLLSAVIDVPINAFRSFFNFDLLGINLADFFFALLTICIILGIIKIIV